ncbi:hypothetical protein ACFV06_11905 [Streptomyces sp. NPDC059618]
MFAQLAKAQVPRLAMSSLADSGVRVTSASVARHFGVPERTGRHYLATAT